MQNEQLVLDKFLKDRENSKRKEAPQYQLEKVEKSINAKYDDLINAEHGFKDLEGRRRKEESISHYCFYYKYSS